MADYTDYFDLAIYRFTADGTTIDDQYAVEIASWWQSPTGNGALLAEFASKLSCGVWDMPAGVRDAIIDAQRELTDAVKANPGAYVDGDLGSPEHNLECLLALLDHFDKHEKFQAMLRAERAHTVLVHDRAYSILG